MRRSRSAAPKATDEGGDDSSPMVVGTGVTMDYSAVDNPSLNVSGTLFLRFICLSNQTSLDRCHILA